MKLVKMIVCDLDGSLLNTKNSISPKTADALRQAKDQGIMLALATARSLTSAENAIGPVNLKKLIDIIISQNGLSICDYRSGLIINRRPLTDSQKTMIISSCKNIPGSFRDADNLRFTAARPFTPTQLEQLRSLTSIACYGRQLGDNRYEFLNSGLGKSSAIEYIAKHYGFQLANVLAFGDSANDIEMLKQCGIGVCLANGSPAAKEAADYITASNDKSGIALFLNKLFIDDLD